MEALDSAEAVARSGPWRRRRRLRRGITEPHPCSRALPSLRAREAPVCRRRSARPERRGRDVAGRRARAEDHRDARRPPRRRHPRSEPAAARARRSRLSARPSIERTAAREARRGRARQQALARNHAINAQLVELRGEPQGAGAGAAGVRGADVARGRARFLSDENALTGWILALEMRLETAMAAIDTGESRPAR